MARLAADTGRQGGERTGSLAALGAFSLSPAGLVVIVAVLTLLRLWFAAITPPTEDEAYYRLWGLYPAWGYLDHPPMVGWWMGAGIALAGDTVLALRLIAVAASALGSLVLYRTARLMFDDARAAGFAVLVLNATILVGAAGLVTTPDQPSALFWGLTLWALAELTHSGRARWWLAAGLFAGLGLMSKYSVLFLGAGMVVWVLAWRENRRWLKAWQFWVAGLLALALFAPVIGWNAGHGWVSFIKQFSRAEPGPPEPEHIPEFIIGEILLVGPLLVPYVLIGAWMSLRAGWQGDRMRGLLVATSVPFVLYLMLHGLHARIQANWPAPLFAATALVAGEAAARLDSRWPAGRWLPVVRLLRWLRPWAIGLGLVLGVAVMAHGARPLGGIISPMDPTQQLRGWPKLVRQIEALRVDAGATWIATQNYAMTGELSYYLPEVPVVQLNERVRYVAAPEPSMALLSQPGLFVGLERNFYPQYLSFRFRDVRQIGVIERVAGGVVLDRYLVMRVADPIANPIRIIPWW
ncbi:glycosyltransferase family 39 protein [Pseudoxanthobacter sp.]|uniref:glycosyltransferase family 39 protein n=1 Tax=Pseudoxanthobacter sp. TaxID=1925742 RepID=UPI002FDF6B9E